MKRRLALVALWLGCVGAGSSACLRAATPQRRFYVLQREPLGGLALQARFNGLVRVRNLDAESSYDKFQIVVRTSPYELTYMEQNVWAVKPNRMVSDQIAAALLDLGMFASVARELGERRPDYILSGDLHAIEIYDSGDVWFAHLALTLDLAEFTSGKTVWTFAFDERKRVPTRSFSLAVRAVSELLTVAIERAATNMATRSSSRAAERPPPSTVRDQTTPQTTEPSRKPEPPAGPQPLFVPEEVPAGDPSGS